jgi:hypothetical protein
MSLGRRLKVPEKKEYKVTGKRSFRGHAPGEKFEAAFTEAQEKRYIGRRSIRLVKKKQADDNQVGPSGSDATTSNKE